MKLVWSMLQIQFPRNGVGDVQITIFDTPVICIYTFDTGDSEITYRCLSLSGKEVCIHKVNTARRGQFQSTVAHSVTRESSMWMEHDLYVRIAASVHSVYRAP
jgi:hypothetical protein